MIDDEHWTKLLQDASFSVFLMTAQVIGVLLYLLLH